MSQERPAPAFLLKIRNLLKRFGAARLVAAGGATVFALTLAVGAGAAPSPVDPFAEVLGLGGAHGAAVSDAVHDAKVTANEAGDPVGPAVSTAACLAAHDRGTLPPGAQNAPGQQDREPKDCTSDDEEDGEDMEEDAADADEAETEDAGEGSGHGAAVSQAVHDARANLEDGEKVGPAVSEAACMAAHDRTTLPEGAQNAHGQVGREPKDCTHPSNAEDGEDESSSNSDTAGESNGHGKQTAPGQLKKQVD
ncbi:MAG TPA: hypothetical protein VFS30_08025 [Dehalococcoidia bacterium]|nr:hypothetical protein [Dehalococcoidia bacterium]